MPALLLLARDTNKQNLHRGHCCCCTSFSNSRHLPDLTSPGVMVRTCPRCQQPGSCPVCPPKPCSSWALWTVPLQGACRMGHLPADLQQSSSSQSPLCYEPVAFKSSLILFGFLACGLRKEGARTGRGIAEQKPFVSGTDGTGDAPLPVLLFTTTALT